MCDLLVSIAKRNGFLELNAGDVASARRACLRGGKPAGFSAAVRAIYNVGHKYVELDERWLAGKKNLRVLQLGQWSPDLNADLNAAWRSRKVRGRSPPPPPGMDSGSVENQRRGRTVPRGRRRMATASAREKWRAQSLG